jgi:hypothetical protein
MAQINLQSFTEQIATIIAEHKSCGGHCHCWDQGNEAPEHVKDNEHLASLIAYYAKGVNDGI